MVVIKEIKFQMLLDLKPDNGVKYESLSGGSKKTMMMMINGMIFNNLN